MTTVTMISSAGEHVAGHDYDLPEELADHYIHCGYADGVPTRDYTQSELDALRELNQAVSV